MEINKKLFLTALSQIKAYKDVVLLQDSPKDGYLDILYLQRTSEKVPNCVNRMSILITGGVTNLFEDTPSDKLGSSVLVHLGRLKSVLKDAESCIIDNGNVNGVCIAVNLADAEYSLAHLIATKNKEYSETLKKENSVFSVMLSKIDYSYIVSECSKFVSHDESRRFMSGICVDFEKANFVNYVATDGRKLCLIKQPLNECKKDGIKFIIHPSCFHVPSSDFNSVQIHLTEKISQLLINTVDYQFEGIFENIEGTFPNYQRVIPEISEQTQWFTLCAASFRMALDSVKSLIGKNEAIYLNGENSKDLTISVAEGTTTLEIEGTSTCPMRLKFSWEHLSPCLFDGLALTKFYTNGASRAILSHEAKAVRGTTLDVTKVFMPLFDPDDHRGDDEFGIPMEASR